MQIIGPGWKIAVSCDISNTGSRPGSEIIQLYIHDVEASVPRPVKELKAFDRIWLKPGETRTARFELQDDAFLSGGEQQMLAIGRILRTGARLLLLDEPTEGLAPVIVQQIRTTIRRLKAQGFTILLVEQNFRFAATVADRHYVMERGRVVDMIGNADLPAQTAKLHEYLGV